MDLFYRIISLENDAKFPFFLPQPIRSPGLKMAKVITLCYWPRFLTYKKNAYHWGKCLWKPDNMFGVGRNFYQTIDTSREIGILMLGHNPVKY